MLLNNVDCLIAGLLPFIVFAMLCATSAYYANAQRSPDDPQKRACHPIVILLAPVILPLQFMVSIVRFILTVLLFGVVLILLPIALIAFRESTFLRSLKKLATGIGNTLLDANTSVAPLVKPESAQPEIKKAPLTHKPVI